MHNSLPMLLKFSSFQFSLFLLLFLLLHVLKLAASSPAEEEFTYNGFSGANLTLDGIATVSSDGLLILTNTTEPQKSHAFHPSPLHFRRNLSYGSIPSFSTTFSFAIVPDEDANLGGTGLAFVITPSTDFSKALSSQYFGLFNMSNNGNATNHVVAIELDTIMNVEFQDINDNHVGIDINGMRSEESRAAGYYVDDTEEFRSLRLISGKAMQVWVDYDSADAKLNVTLSLVNATGKPTTKPTKPLISFTVNLSTVLLDLPVHVGFSTGTYPLLTSHYVLGWSFAMNVGQAQAPPLDYSKLPAIPRTNHKGHRSWALGLWLAASLVFVLLVTFVAFAAAWWRSKYAEIREDWEVEFGPHRFSYRDLYQATDGFRERELLGVGGFGKVYRGTLPTSRAEVAVKRVSHESRQGIREFVAEIASIGRLRHRNIVQLLGYCRRRGELLLVYDFVPNGSLDKYLHYGQQAHKPALGWSQRFQIVKGVAAGLLYLHEGWEQVVVHRDIKASNVLLDGEMNAKLGDFGLARLFDHGTNLQTTHVVGTTGYIAPELARTGRATTATDVFAFGVFILEIVCGRRPVEQPMIVDGQGEQFLLVDWVAENWRRGSILNTVDVGLMEGEYAKEEAETVLKLGLMCLHPHVAARPSMWLVVQYLEGRTPLPELSPTYLICFTSLPLPRNVGFDVFVPSYPSSVPSASTLSGGR